MQKRTLVKFIDKWTERFPLSKREQDWAKSWSKWANKSREEVIQMTNHMMTLKQCEDRLKFLRETRGWYK
jgi:hypothetical protein